MILERRTTRRAIRTLNRRRDWLVTRVVQSRKELAFDNAERHALELSIDVLNALLTGQKVEVPGGRHRAKHGIGNAESRASSEIGQSDLQRAVEVPEGATQYG